MAFDRYDLETSKHPDWNIRWIQPPQAAYLVSTVDGAGNANLTPVTMGTAMYSPVDAWWYSLALLTNATPVPTCARCPSV